MHEAVNDREQVGQVLGFCVVLGLARILEALRRENAEEWVTRGWKKRGSHHDFRLCWIFKNGIEMTRELDSLAEEIERRDRREDDGSITVIR